MAASQAALNAATRASASAVNNAANSASSSGSSSASLMSRIENGFLKKYLGVEGGVMLRGKTFDFINKNPTLKPYNNALFLAPAWKWGLAIVPLAGVFTGTPPVDKLDLNTSFALVLTGSIWAYYATLVRPKAVSLMSVSLALVVVHGYNIARKLKYEHDQSKAEEERGKENLAQRQ